MNNNPSKEQLIDALYAQFVQLCEDNDSGELDNTEEGYLGYLKILTHEQLVYETGCDEEFTLDEFMHAWS
jgi:hypothetical protein